MYAGVKTMYAGVRRSVWLKGPLPTSKHLDDEVVVEGVLVADELRPEGHLQRAE